MPPEDNRPIEELLDAAGRAVQPAHPGWADLPQRLGRTPQTPRPRWGRWWLLTPLPLAAAAAAVIFLLTFSGQQPTARADDQPVRVEPLDVDLTVLSVQETEGETLYMPILQQVGRWVANPGLTEEVGRQISLASGKSVYAAPYPQPARKLTGQALVKDHRLVFNLKEGDNIVRFTNVAATIDPTSVRLVSDRPGTVVKEQDFEYDLATADALLKRYLDRQIVCVARDGHEIPGFLVSYDDNAIVLAEGPPSPDRKKVRKTSSLMRRELQAIRLNELPRDLLVKPTLVWKLHVEKAGKHDMTLSYLCGFIKWQADYVIVVTPGEGSEPDLLDVTGWVSLENTTGATYDRAGLKLIAGDVHRKRDPWAPLPEPPPMAMWKDVATRLDAAGKDGKSKKEFVEKSFFEYHLYSLTAPSTVRDRQMKQLNLLSRQQVKASRRYVYDPYLNNSRPAIELEAKNEKANHLGIPLPRGRVTFEQRDADGETAVLGRTEIDHTALKEKLKLKYGFAFDVAGEYSQVDYQRIGPRHWTYTYRMRVRNHKTGDIQVRSVAHLSSGAKITQTTMPLETHDVQTAYFNFSLKANAEQEITYTVDYEY